MVHQKWCIIQLDTEYEDEMDIARSWIYGAEKGEYSITDAYEVIESIAGNEIINEYNQKSSKSAERYDRRTSRGKSQSDSYHSSFMQERIRRANEIIHSVNKEKTSSEDGVFFDAENNVKYSIADSDGNQLTKEQQEYFKNSKARNADGNLMVVYHGSKDFGFTEFDTAKADDKTSLFFTNSEDMANSYVNDKSKLYKTYLNLENPYVVDAKGH